MTRSHVVTSLDWSNFYTNFFLASNTYYLVFFTPIEFWLYLGIGIDGDILLIIGLREGGHKKGVKVKPSFSPLGLLQSSLKIHLASICSSLVSRLPFLGPIRTFSSPQNFKAFTFPSWKNLICLEIGVSTPLLIVLRCWHIRLLNGWIVFPTYIRVQLHCAMYTTPDVLQLMKSLILYSWLSMGLMNVFFLGRNSQKEQVPQGCEPVIVNVSQVWGVGVHWKWLCTNDKQVPSPSATPNNLPTRYYTKKTKNLGEKRGIKRISIASIIEDLCLHMCSMQSNNLPGGDEVLRTNAPPMPPMD